MNKIKIQINISRKVFDAIEDNHIAPKPRWHFIAQEAGVWILGIGTTVLGAAAFSTVLFVLAVVPVKYQSITHKSALGFWTEMLPILWLVLFVCFIFATDFFLKKTKRGYKYSFVALTLSSMTISLVLGYIGFAIGIGEVVERGVGQRIPFHTPVHIVASKAWSNIEEGLISGKLGDSGNIFITSKGKTFILDLDEVPQQQIDILKSQEAVGLIGTSTSPTTFTVCMIIPFEKKDFKIEPEQFERNESVERTNLCKGVRPYMRLKTQILK